MKRILLRAGLNPLENVNIADVIANNLIGDNTGNLIYANSLYRALMMDENTKIVPDTYSLTKFDAPRINEEFDSYIIPLADMFRNDHFEMNRITNLVKALKIPCIVVGVGLRANSTEQIEKGFEFDESVKEFVCAVLEKSAIIGIRGEYTARYLSKLGFKENVDFTVIGCPSMFTYGERLQRKPLNIGNDSFISVNSSIISSQNSIDFCMDILKNYENRIFIPQRIDELKTLYLGCDYIHATKRSNYPDTASSSIYTQDRVRMFLQANQWIDYLKAADLSIGARIHGNIAAVLAGTPAVFIPHGLRMKELISYHGLPHITNEELKKCKTLEDALEKVDFDLMFKRQEENFERYKSFLKANRVENIYNENYAPYDDLLSKNTFDYSVPSTVNYSLREIANRFEGVYQHKDSLYTEASRLLKSLDRTSIKTDIRLLSSKAIDKLKGIRRTNTQRLEAINAAKAEKE